MISFLSEDGDFVLMNHGEGSAPPKGVLVLNEKYSTRVDSADTNSFVP